MSFATCLIEYVFLTVVAANKKTRAEYSARVLKNWSLLFEVLVSAVKVHSLGYSLDGFPFVRFRFKEKLHFYGDSICVMVNKDNVSFLTGLSGFKPHVYICCCRYVP